MVTIGCNADALDLAKGKVVLSQDRLGERTDDDGDDDAAYYSGRDERSSAGFGMLTA